VWPQETEANKKEKHSQKPVRPEENIMRCYGLEEKETGKGSRTKAALIERVVKKRRAMCGRELTAKNHDEIFNLFAGNLWEKESKRTKKFGPMGGKKRQAAGKCDEDGTGTRLESSS